MFEVGDVVTITDDRYSFGGSVGVIERVSIGHHEVRIIERCPPTLPDAYLERTWMIRAECLEKSTPCKIDDYF